MNVEKEVGGLLSFNWIAWLTSLEYYYNLVPLNKNSNKKRKRFGKPMPLSIDQCFQLLHIWLPSNWLITMKMSEISIMNCMDVLKFPKLQFFPKTLEICTYVFCQLSLLNVKYNSKGWQHWVFRILAKVQSPSWMMFENLFYYEHRLTWSNVDVTNRFTQHVEENARKLQFENNCNIHNSNSIVKLIAYDFFSLFCVQTSPSIGGKSTLLHAYVGIIFLNRNASTQFWKYYTF